MTFAALRKLCPPPAEETIAGLARALQTQRLSDRRTWLEVARWAAEAERVPLSSVLLEPWRAPAPDRAAAILARHRLFHELARLGVKVLSISLVFRQGSSRQVTLGIAEHAARLGTAPGPAPAPRTPPVLEEVPRLDVAAHDAPHDALPPPADVYREMFGRKCPGCGHRGHVKADCPKLRSAPPPKARGFTCNAENLTERK